MAVTAERHYADLPALQHALAGAPLWLLDAGREPRTLRGMGLRTVADLERIAAPGLARRVGDLRRARSTVPSAPDPTPRDWINAAAGVRDPLGLFNCADTAEQVLHRRRRCLHGSWPGSRRSTRWQQLVSR